MRHTRRLLAAVALFLMAGVWTHGADWPAWRGPHGNGVCDETGLPLKWSATENVAWKAPLPGPGNSTPIVSRGRVYVTCGSEKGATRSLLCFDRTTGQQRWRKDVKFAGEETTHETNPYCAASPTTDGRRVFASFGSAGVVACDAEDGKLLWHRDLGPMHHIWGNASSPVFHGGKLFFLCGPGPEARLLALNPDNGQTRWENDLSEARGKPDQYKGAWNTPVVHTREDGSAVLIMDLPGYVAGFDPNSGKELWRCRGLGDLAYNNAVVGEGVIVALSGFQGPGLAMRLPAAGETGDLTASHRLWRVEKGNPQRVGSGVISGGYFYILNDPGVAECIELRTGKQVWKERASGSSWSSMVLSGDRLYAVDQGGQAVVLRAGPKFELLAENPLGETTRASLAPSDGQIFARTYRALYCIGKPSTK